jgi:plastocyanin
MKKALFGFALILAALALVACGGDDDDSDTTGGGATTTTESDSETGGGGGKDAELDGGGLVFMADPNGALAYTTDEVATSDGKMEIEFSNPQPIAHDVVIEDSSGKEIAATEVITEGSDSTVADIKPGKYTFFCSVPGHREAGMEGKLTAG